MDPGPAAPVESDELALPLPRSLRGTEVDGGFDLDADGRFLPTERALWLFDYFLSTIGELDLDGIRARVRAEARAQLPESEVEAVMALFERYLRYREQAAAAAEDLDPDDDLMQAFEDLVALQEREFGADDATRMFGRQNALREATLRRREILGDAALDPEERAEALAAVEAELPEELRAMRARMAAPARARAEVEALRAAGADEGEVFAVRAQHFGEAAATRLASFEAERAEWEARVDAYREARDLLRSSGGSETQVAQLRGERFQGPELLRIQALERIEEASP